MASNAQIQQWSDQRTRQRAEQVRALLLAMEDDIASFDDCYATLNTPECDWEDTRTDGPPNMMTKSDLLGINAFINDIKTAMRTNDQLPVVFQACVRSVSL